METQKSIAARLGKVCDLIDKRQAQLAQLDTLAKSLFVEMFGDMDTNPKGWRKVPLREHAKVIVGFPFSSSGFSETGNKIVGGYVLMQGFILWNECKYWPSSSSHQKYLLQDGDIVIAMDRPWVGNGFKIAQVDSSHLPALLIQRTACIRSRSMEKSFLFAMLNSRWFADHCNIKGSLVPHISNRDIDSFEVFEPPEELQHLFSERVKFLDKSKFAILRWLSYFDREAATKSARRGLSPSPWRDRDWLMK